MPLMVTLEVPLLNWFFTTLQLKVKSMLPLPSLTLRKKLRFQRVSMPNSVESTANSPMPLIESVQSRSPMEAYLITRRRS